MDGVDADKLQFLADVECHYGNVIVTRFERRSLFPQRDVAMSFLSSHRASRVASTSGKRVKQGSDCILLLPVVAPFHCYGFVRFPLLRKVLTLIWLLC